MEVTPDEVKVMDNDSKNWTLINDARIMKADGPKHLRNGDKLTVADMVFEVEICK
jgi:predicted component of type VI protein secretion system